MYRRIAMLGNYRNRRGPQRLSFERTFKDGNIRARYDFDFELPLTLGELTVTVLP
jgi:hypothetical protein